MDSVPICPTVNGQKLLDTPFFGRECQRGGRGKQKRREIEKGGGVPRLEARATQGKDSTECDVQEPGATVPPLQDALRCGDDVARDDERSVCMSMYHFMVCAEEQTNLVGECVAGETSG